VNRQRALLGTLTRTRLSTFRSTPTTLVPSTRRTCQHRERAGQTRFSVLSGSVNWTWTGTRSWSAWSTNWTLRN